MFSVETINQKIQSAKALDFGDIFNKSIELFKKTWLQGFLMQLFVFLLMLPFIIIIYIPLVMAIVAQEGGYGSGGYDSDIYGGVFAGFSLIYILVLIVAFLMIAVISVCLQAAFYRIMNEIDMGRSVTTSDFFYFLKAKYLTKALLLMIVSSIIAVISAMLCYIPLIYAMVPLSFFVMFFAFNPEMSLGDIVSCSFKLGTKKWLIAFGLLIVSSLLAQIVGLLLCGIGILFTSAFVYHPAYFIYKEVIGFESTSEIDTIGAEVVE